MGRIMGPFRRGFIGNTREGGVHCRGEMMDALEARSIPLLRCVIGSRKLVSGVFRSHDPFGRWVSNQDE